ncbi:MAG TPA: signal recognition particle receptor subunit alpha, partial [Streptosporangiaceae bacterium]
MAYLILIIVAVVIVLGGGGALLLRPRRRTALRRSAPPAAPSAPAGQGTAEVGQPAAGQAAPAQAGPAQAGPAQAGTVELERPPPSAGRLVALRSRLARSQSGLGSVLLALLSRDRLDEDTWQEIEDTLITADVGVAPSRQIVDELQTKVKVLGSRGAEEARALLRTELLAQVDPGLDRSLRSAPHAGHPAVMLMVGVNGTGKTTACGKL